mgnify:CR=1 FL=1
MGNQKNLVDIFNDNLENIYTSRTFCLLEDVEKIKKIGLAKGGSLENAVVISDKKVLNKIKVTREIKTAQTVVAPYLLINDFQLIVEL